MHLTDNGYLDPTAVVYEPVLVLKPETVEIGAHSRIDSFVKIEGGKGVWLGRHVHVSSFAHLNIGGGRLIVGDHVACASGCRIFGGTNTPAGWSMSSASPAEKQVVERLTTTIAERAFVGAGATVMPGVTVGERAVVGAGAVVTHDIPPGEIWAGVPARKIGDRP